MITEPESRVLANALMKWCHAISNTYGVAVNNLTSSLSDGRALCLLIHYYHPTILSTSMIQNTTASLLQPYHPHSHPHPHPYPLSQDRDSDNDYTLQLFTDATTLHGKILSKHEIKKGVEGERKNFAILRR